MHRSFEYYQEIVMLQLKELICKSDANKLGSDYCIILSIISKRIILNRIQSVSTFESERPFSKVVM